MQETVFLALSLTAMSVINSTPVATAECSSQQTWAAPGDSLNEWNSIQVKANTTDRLTIVPAPGRTGQALRAEVRDGDQAVNSAGKPIAGGWRAEAVGPVESQSDRTVRYSWSTMLAPGYPSNPVGSDGTSIWQVITQWHQGSDDQGGSPPIAFIIVGDQIRLHLHRPDQTEVGQYPVASRDPGSWHNFHMDVRWSMTTGSIKVWHNGTLVQNLPSVQTLFPRRDNPALPGTAYLKMGLYRKAVSTSTAGQFVLYHDDVRRSALSTPVAGTEKVLRPDGDVIRQWTGGTAGTAAAAIDDPVTRPTAVDATDYVYSGGAGRRTEVTLTDEPPTDGTAAVTGWFYANAGAGTELRADLVRGGTVLATTTVAAGSGFAWRSMSSTASAAIPPADVNDLRLHFTTLGGGNSNVRAAYAALMVTACQP